MHKRNRYRSGYDFEKLCRVNKDLSAYVRDNGFGNLSIDFSDPIAVTELNRSLLLADYGLVDWKLKEGFLCPPVPGRADYIHEIADLLAETIGRKASLGPKVNVLDIGTGANLIYPIIGSSDYGWRFIGSDVSSKALEGAEEILRLNPGLVPLIELRLQSNPHSIFKGILNKSDQITVTMCNPPFHDSAKAAVEANRRKRTNLNLTAKDDLNFGGQASELWFKGGELAFVRNIILESQQYRSQVGLFTSLISKKKNIAPLMRLLKRLRCKSFDVRDMSQGQKQSRLLHWRW